MATLFEEFKRRNVIRAALAYLAAAWLVAQLITVLGDLVSLPAWVGAATLIVLASGFVVVVVLAWMYEWTGQGFKTEAEIRADPSLVRVPARYLDYLIIALLTVALGYFIWESRFEARTRAPGAISVAVLPFDDLSPDGGLAWFANGMADELMNALVRFPGLRVAGRRSASSFDPERQSLADFADSAGVSHVLEGSVRTAADRIRVSAQLVRAVDGFNVWSQVFDEDSSDVFDVQDRISTGVLNGLRLHVDDPGDRFSAAAKERNTDFKAYQAYLQGRYFLSRRTAQDLEQAAQYFGEALRLEPGLSSAHSALAAVYAFMPYYAQQRSLQEAGRLATTHAETAIRLDPGNAEAHSILGVVQMNFSREWARAQHSMARAFELSAGDAEIVNLYGDYFYNVGDYLSAEEMESTAAALEPLSAVHQLELGLVYDFRGQYEKAVQQAELAISLNRDLPNAWWQLCRSYLHAGRIDEAARQLRENPDRLGPRYAARVRALLAAHDGDQDLLRSIAAGEERSFLENGGSATTLAFLFALAGDDGAAARYIELAFESGDAILVSPMYFFLPEDWDGLPGLRRALDKPGLRELYELRRNYIASGAGRVLPPSTARN